MKALAAISVVAVALFMSPAVFAREDADLSYGPSEGLSWSMKFETTARIPVVGEKRTVVVYDLSCLGGSGEFVRMALHVPETTVGNEVIGPVDATFNLGTDGAISSLQSSQLDDALIGPLLRNTALLFPRLPGGVVAPGDQWSWRVTLHLPKTTVKALKSSRAGFPEKLRLDSKYSLQRLQDGSAVISVELKQAPGEKIRVNLKGTEYFSLTDKRIRSAVLKGQIKVKKGLFWITVPIGLSVITVNGR